VGCEVSDLEVFYVVSTLSDWASDRTFKRFLCRRGLKFTERGYARWLLATQ
jgi:hypothetical protein